MGMQYDVKSLHAQSSKVVVNYRTRLKSVIVSPATASQKNVAFANNVTKTGTYDIPTSTTCTVTITNHGLTTGDRVWLDFTSGTAVDNVYVVTVTTANAFEVTTASLTTSGNVTMYADILLEVDTFNATAFSVLIPGEGVLAENGIYVGLVSNVTATVIYG